eukprot:g1279.t1
MGNTNCCRSLGSNLPSTLLSHPDSNQTNNYVIKAIAQSSEDEWNTQHAQVFWPDDPNYFQSGAQSVDFLIYDNPVGDAAPMPRLSVRHLWMYIREQPRENDFKESVTGQFSITSKPRETRWIIESFASPEFPDQVRDEDQKGIPLGEIIESVEVKCLENSETATADVSKLVEGINQSQVKACTAEAEKLLIRSGPDARSLSTLSKFQVTFTFHIKIFPGSERTSERKGTVKVHAIGIVGQTPVPKNSSKSKSSSATASSDDEIALQSHAVLAGKPWAVVMPDGKSKIQSQRFVTNGSTETRNPVKGGRTWSVVYDCSRKEGLNLANGVSKKFGEETEIESNSIDVRYKKWAVPSVKLGGGPTERKISWKENHCLKCNNSRADAMLSFATGFVLAKADLNMYGCSDLLREENVNGQPSFGKSDSVFRGPDCFRSADIIRQKVFYKKGGALAD